jgi:hypothetical protein
MLDVLKHDIDSDVAESNLRQLLCSACALMIRNPLDFRFIVQDVVQRALDDLLAGVDATPGAGLTLLITTSSSVARSRVGSPVTV